MTEEKPVDEKTARLIDEMDKSLHNMEQTLGRDHLVLAKILDSYAKLLRQNNLRHLDALNMEARAKAIRAKHNQKEAEEQSIGINKTAQRRSMSAGKVKVFAWLLSLICLAFFASNIQQMLKWSTTKNMDKLKRHYEEHERAMANAADNPEDNEGMLAENENADKSLAVATALQTEHLNSERKEENPGEKKVTVLQFIEQTLKIKRLAKEQLALGKQAENDKDFPKASAAYLSVIKAVSEADRPVASEEIADCYEGYGRMVELEAQSELAAKCAADAARIREMAHSSQ